jgi:hypothetical protein
MGTRWREKPPSDRVLDELKNEAQKMKGEFYCGRACAFEAMGQK